MLLEQAFLSHDFYEAMGLEAAATQPDIEQAFKDLSADLDLRHPDESERIQAAEKMLSLTQAYEVLSDPVMRSRYDIQILGRKNYPTQDRVEILFKEGIRAWRNRNTDLALRLLKEVASLYPHRPLYRVHLAIAYAEKEWLSFTESELETALRLDPNYKFAKETIAKILFQLPDKKRLWYQSALNRQVAVMAAGFVLVGVLLASGLPQQLFGGLFNQWTRKAPVDKSELYSQLPEDLRQDLEAQGSLKPASTVSIKQFEADYKPDGKVYDYTQQEAVEKRFYGDQAIVVLTYKDGSTLNYRPADLLGWKRTQAGLPVMITRNNELIPSPDSLPVLLPTNQKADFSDPNFPAALFPEYAQAATSATPAAPESAVAPPPAFDTPKTQTPASQAPPSQAAPPASAAATTPAKGGATNYNPYSQP